MTLVNHSLQSLSQGVSQQHEEARFETQVEEMINCIPDVSRGVYRRNPLVDRGEINNTSFSSTPNFFEYSYDRGDGERYMIMINGDGELSVTDLTDFSNKFTTSSPYLNVVGTETYKEVFNSFTANTVGDFTFIVNKNKKVDLKNTTSEPLDAEKKVGIYWIKNVTSIETSVRTEGSTNSTSTAANVQGHTYTLNGESVTAQRTFTWTGTEFVLDVDLLEAEKIAAQLATQLGSNYASEGAFVYWVGTGEPPTWEWSDSVSSSASFGFNGVVSSAAELPAVLPTAIVDYYTTTRSLGGIFVYVTLGTNDGIGYWLKYENEISWVEDKKPGLKNILDETTLPHVLFRDGDGIFYFKPYTATELSSVADLADTTLGWKPRVVGDNTTAKAPSLVGSAIEDIFFYQNRLGVITKEHILFSEINNYGNFFPTTVRTLVDSDVIDLTVAGQSVSVLRFAIEVADRLVVFSDNTQFIISSSGPLSPNTAIVGIASKYNILPSAKPIVVGDAAFFVSTIGQSEHLYKYTLSERVDNKFVATDVTLQAPTYLAGNTFKLIGHSTLGYVLLLDYNSQTMYVFNGTIVGEQVVQAAIHRWDTPFPVIGGSIIDNQLFLPVLDSQNNKTILTTMNLNTPTNYTTISYLDVVDGVSYAYNSLVEFSEWQVKVEDFGTRRGRLQIRTLLYSIDENSRFSTVITNQDLTDTTFDSLIKSGFWDDTLLWCDACPWLDNGYKFNRIYNDDDKVTVMGNSARTTIVFKENENVPDKGFNLKTVNYEGMFYQRSQRY